ncbi:hypothetical protein C8Q74DRAFT_1367324 [Fomes fomentarius]|nr:hypothetical protein C8Q74DRAFT_1367324 [Fomes fomentarius]
MNDLTHSNDLDELKRWLSIYQGKSRKQAQENFDLTAENAYLKEQVARLQAELKRAQDVDASATCPGCASRSQLATRRRQSSDTGLKTPPPSNRRTPEERLKVHMSIRNEQESSEEENLADVAADAWRRRMEERATAKRKRVESSRRDVDSGSVASSRVAMKRPKLAVPQVVVTRLTPEARKRYTSFSASPSPPKYRRRAPVVRESSEQEEDEEEDEDEKDDKDEDEEEEEEEEEHEEGKERTCSSLSDLSELSELEPSRPSTPALPTPAKSRQDMMDVDPAPATEKIVQPNSASEPSRTQQKVIHHRSPSRELSYFNPEEATAAAQRAPAPSSGDQPDPNGATQQLATQEELPPPQPMSSSQAAPHPDPLMSASTHRPSSGQQLPSTAQQEPSTMQHSPNPQHGPLTTHEPPASSVNVSPNINHSLAKPLAATGPSQTALSTRSGPSQQPVAPGRQTPTPAVSSSSAARPVGSSHADQANPYQNRPKRYEQVIVGGIRVKIPPPLMNAEAHQDRMSGCEPFEVSVESEFSKATAGRFLLNDAFGGSTNAVVTVSQIGENFLFPRVSMNPHLPRYFGMPGLFLTATKGQQWKTGPQKVILGICTQHYWYLGDYELTPAKHIEAEEYRDWPLKLKEEWAGRAGSQRDIRARVALRRKLNREPAPDEVAAAFVGNRNPFKDIKVEQIIEDYDKGLETMYVWRMNCARFDNEFLHEIYQVLAKHQDKKVKIGNPAMPENETSSAPAPTQELAHLPQ